MGELSNERSDRAGDGMIVDCEKTLAGRERIEREK